MFVDEKKDKAISRLYPAILSEQAWSITDLLHGKITLFSCETQWVILLASHGAGFGSFCPLPEPVSIVEPRYNEGPRDW